MEDLKCSAQIEQAETDTKQISKDDEPRQQPSEPQIEIAISNLFAALRSAGLVAGINAARSAAQQRIILTNARRSGVKALLEGIRGVEEIMVAAEAAAKELAEAEEVEQQASFAPVGLARAAEAIGQGPPTAPTPERKRMRAPKFTV